MVSAEVSADSEYVKRLRAFIETDTFFAKMVKLVDTDTELSVICHGDCWTNNFLYRYDDLGTILETCLVDFQLIRYGSPALDISNLIFCCTEKTQRSEHMQDWLKLYHRELVQSLRVLGSLPTFCGDTEDELWRK